MRRSSARPRPAPGRGDAPTVMSSARSRAVRQRPRRARRRRRGPGSRSPRRSRLGVRTPVAGEREQPAIITRSGRRSRASSRRASRQDDREREPALPLHRRGTIHQHPPNLSRAIGMDFASGTSRGCVGFTEKGFYPANSAGARSPWRARGADLARALHSSRQRAECASRPNPSDVVLISTEREALRALGSAVPC